MKNIIKLFEDHRYYYYKVIGISINPKVWKIVRNKTIQYFHHSFPLQELHCEFTSYYKAGSLTTSLFYHFHPEKFRLYEGIINDY